MDILSILPFMVILETDAAKAIGAAIAMAVGGIGPALAIGMLVGKAMEALGRNPEARAQVIMTTKLTTKAGRFDERHLRLPAHFAV